MLVLLEVEYGSKNVRVEEDFGIESAENGCNLELDPRRALSLTSTGTEGSGSLQLRGRITPRGSHVIQDP